MTSDIYVFKIFNIPGATEHSGGGAVKCQMSQNDHFKIFNIPGARAWFGEVFSISVTSGNRICKKYRISRSTGHSGQGRVKLQMLQIVHSRPFACEHLWCILVF